MGTFDVIFPLGAYVAKFAAVARNNGWNAPVKLCAFTSQLRGSALELLTTLPPLGATTGVYQVLLNALEARFGNHDLHFCQYVELQNRHQHLGDLFQAPAAIVERVA